MATFVAAHSGIRLGSGLVSITLNGTGTDRVIVAVATSRAGAAQTLNSASLNGVAGTVELTNSAVNGNASTVGIATWNNAAHPGAGTFDFDFQWSSAAEMSVTIFEFSGAIQTAPLVAVTNNARTTTIVSGTTLTQAGTDISGKSVIAYVAFDDSSFTDSTWGTSANLTNGVYADNTYSHVYAAIDESAATATESYDITYTNAGGTDPDQGNHGIVVLSGTSTAPTIGTVPATAYPGETVRVTGTNLTGATATLGGVAQTVTVIDSGNLDITIVRGGMNYGADKTLTVTTSEGSVSDSTMDLVAEPGTFAVTAASPNTTDDASLWTGLVKTSDGSAITIVDGDQAWVKNPNNLTNLAITPAGEISADVEGDFVVQIWLASEGVWGGDQTVTFAVPGGAGILQRLRGFRPAVRTAVRSGVTASVH